MRNILFIVVYLVILSCNNSQHSSSTHSDTTVTLDTILHKNGKFLFYQNITDTSYILIWGNNTIKNIAKDTVHILPSGKLNLEWYSDKAICVRQGCGSSCFYAYVLPLLSNAMEKFYMYPLAYDTVKNLIAYNDDSSAFITIENFITGKKINIKEDFLPGPFQGYCIDSIAFNPKGLYVKWKDSKEKLVTKTFDVENL